MRVVVTDLAAERGGQHVFSGLFFSLEQGNALVVTGENGSGKSTLLRIICGLLEPVRGFIRLESGDGLLDLQSSLHYLGHQNAMKPSLTVRENLQYWREFNGNPHIAIDDALEQVGLIGIDHLPFGYLSTGQKRRVSIAKLLVSYRQIWVVDEPTAGLDEASEKRFAALMKAHLAEGGMIIAATHIPLGLEGAQRIDLGAYQTESAD
jgi:heme exporter protein A